MIKMALLVLFICHSDYVSVNQVSLLTAKLCLEGIHDEKGSQKEELDRAVVCPSSQLTVILRL